MDRERVAHLSHLIREKTKRLHAPSQELRRRGAVLEDELNSTGTSPEGGTTNGQDQSEGRADARAVVAR